MHNREGLAVLDLTEEGGTPNLKDSNQQGSET